MKNYFVYDSDNNEKQILLAEVENRVLTIGNTDKVWKSVDTSISILFTRNKFSTITPKIKLVDWKIF